MNRNHVYLQLIQIVDVEALKVDWKIKRANPHNLECQNKSLRSEYGTLDTFENTFHILVGDLPVKGCHWCGNDVELIVLEPYSQAGITPPKSWMFMQCPRCFARGPVLHVCEKALETKESKNEIERMVAERYKQINPFRGFVNPYRENTYEPNRSDTKTT